jgi:hypothetical protein
MGTEADQKEVRMNSRIMVSPISRFIPQLPHVSGICTDKATYPKDEMRRKSWKWLNVYSFLLIS